VLQEGRDRSEYDDCHDQADHECRIDSRHSVQQIISCRCAQPAPGDKKPAQDEETGDRPRAQVLTAYMRPLASPSDIPAVSEQDRGGENESEEIQTVLSIRERSSGENCFQVHLRRFLVAISSSER
jgi:hypothetical protein